MGVVVCVFVPTAAGCDVRIPGRVVRSSELGEHLSEHGPG